MQIIDSTILRDKYDVIVVGAGIGGITAGALLAKKGLSVLVIEQHYLPGGVCSTVKRKGIAMDAGAALLFGWGESEGSAHRFVMNVLEEEIDMIQHEAIYRMHFGEKSVTFWRDFNRYFKELNEAFPGKEKQFRGFYDHCFKVFNDVNKNPMPMSPDTIPRSLGLKMLLKNPISTMKMPKYMNTSMKEVLDLYVQDPFVEGFFDLLIASCYCTTVEETPLLLAAAVVCETHGGGAFYPSGSPQMLPNKLEKAFEKYGGQIIYRHLVEEILLENGKAFGVRLQNGIEILGERIVSNATVWNLYEKLINPKHIKPERIKWAQDFKPTFGACILYIGVDEEAIPKGTQNIEAYIGDLQDLSRNNYFVYIPSIDDPSICPEGTHSISVLCSAGNYKWPRPWEQEYQSEEYIKAKEEIAEKALDVIESKFPNFRKHIRTIDIATPSTTERFTLKNWGNIGGPKQMLGQHIFKRLKARSEFQNLYCVGDSTAMGEGVISVTSSAVGAANMILEDLKQEIYLPQKFKKQYVNLVKGKPRIPLPSQEEELTEVTAKRLAIECQWCEDPVCMKKCPAEIDILNFVRRLEVGNYSGAARALREMNPLAEICGIVCPVENLCESECKHLEFSNEPVRIGKLQAWVCEQAKSDGWDKSIPKSNGKKIAVVGAGPAGLTCAHFLTKVGYIVDLFEKENKIGGIIAQAIPPFRLSDEVLERELKEIIANPNLNIHYGKELGNDLFVKELTQNYDSVFLALGLGSGRSLSIPGMDEVKIDDALTFLKNFRSKTLQEVKGNVLVIGGGSVAADAAIVAARAGAKKVTIICLESEDEMPCLRSELDELQAEKIEVFNSWGPKTFSAQENKLTCISCTSVFDEKGNFCPSYEESKTFDIEFNQAILAVGQAIEPKLANYLEREFGKGLIKVNCETQLIEGKSNIYAGGDIIRGAGTIVEAVADGRRAAIAIHNNLKK
ncbi:MAG TPA: FAD-dependent oxidoreductase [candidate division Zixibacteria bacterium]|nr:FAD-dependent oxidoreductase [candidate division Zixibacteria bacterium]